eukprot:3293715-Pleurochrysis_carterae.AAC.1
MRASAWWRSMESAVARGQDTNPAAGDTRDAAPPMESAAAEAATEGAGAEAAEGEAAPMGASAETAEQGAWRADVRAFVAGAAALDGARPTSIAG